RTATIAAIAGEPPPGLRVDDAYGALLMGAPSCSRMCSEGRRGRAERRRRAPAELAVGFPQAPSGLEAERLDERPPDRERAPEQAAVGGDGEAVARAVDDQVGVLLRDRHGGAAGKARAGLTPGHAGVVRDHQRRLAVDDRNDRRAERVRAEDARE